MAASASTRLYYTVAEGWDGRFSVSSFGGRTVGEERRYCLTMYRRCHGVFATFEQAEAKRRELEKAA